MKKRREWQERRIPFILAGGLSSENVEEGIRLFEPDVVDVSSSVEVEHGNEVTQQTSESLNKVITELDTIITEVANIRIASDRQAVSVKEIEDGVKQIDDVIQTNSAASQEASATSEELSAEATSLDELVDRFKLLEQ